jgi:type IV secretory pathway TrbL component
MKTVTSVSIACALGLTISAAALPLAAQATGTPAPKTMEHHGASSGWKELDAFHALMAATWHPAKSGDLKVIREKADSLSASAKVWAASKVPAACDTKPIRDAIGDVVTGSAKVAQLVTDKGADADVRTALSDVHDRFEVVEHGCQPKHH